MKAGFAGTEVPKLICPSHVGRPKHLRVMQGAAEGEVFVGERAKDLRGLLKLNYPIRHGTTVDWSDQHTHTQRERGRIEEGGESRETLVTSARNMHTY